MARRILIITLLAAAQLSTVCPLVRCDGPGGHQQVEVAHDHCASAEAVIVRPFDHETLIETSTCTDTLLDLSRSFEAPGSSKVRDQLVSTASVAEILMIVIEPGVQSRVSHRSVIPLLSSLPALRTVVLIV